MKDLILMILSAIAVFGVSVYVLALVVFPRHLLEIPDAGPNVGEEE